MLVVVDYSRPEYMHDEDGRLLSEADLAREVCFKLSETETMWLLEMPSVSVMGESDEALEIVRQNSRYEEVRVSQLVLRASM